MSNRQRCLVQRDEVYRRQKPFDSTEVKIATIRSIIGIIKIKYLKLDCAINCHANPRPHAVKSNQVLTDPIDSVMPIGRWNGSSMAGRR